MSEKQWDVFISYASEDKDAIAEPLAQALRHAGIMVWLDQQELKLGDSLSEKIDEGLANSHFGVVILSQAFLNKHWTKKELAGLRAREEEGRKVILPVWHGIAKSDILKYSPILADGLAATTGCGIEGVATQIVKVVFDPKSTSPSAKHPSLTRVMLKLLDEPPNRATMVEFLQMAEKIVDMWHIFGPNSRSFDGEIVGDVKFDVVATYSGHGVRHTFSLLSEVWSDPFENSHEEAPLVSREVTYLLDSIANSRNYFLDHWQTIHPVLLDKARRRRSLYTGRDEEAWYSRFLSEQPDIMFQLYCGRRREIDRTDRKTLAWGSLRKKYHFIEIRSYDAIVDALFEKEKSS